MWREAYCEYALFTQSHAWSVKIVLWSVKSQGIFLSWWVATLPLYTTVELTNWRTKTTLHKKIIIRIHVYPFHIEKNPQLYQIDHRKHRTEESSNPVKSEKENWFIKLH